MTETLLKTLYVDGYPFVYDGFTNRIGFAGQMETHTEYTGIFDKSAEIRKYERENTLKVMILQVTRQCNLRCSYCVYSGQFAGFLPHADASMTIRTVHAAIDFFEEHSRKSKEVGIGFFGGEALMNFSLIQEAVRYAFQKIKNRSIKYSISTNGLLLTPKIVSYLKAHPEVSICVTLNGEHHDEDRRDLFNQGSFDRIMNHLDTIRIHEPLVWEKQISFISNIRSIVEVEEMMRFYRERVGKLPDLITRIRMDRCTTDCLDETAFDREEEQRIRNAFLAQPRGSYGILFQNVMEQLHHRTILGADAGLAFVIGCSPMSNRIFIDTEGKLSICERVPDSVCLGNVFEGYDNEGIERYHNYSKAFVERNCMHCWLQHLCPLCFSELLEPDGTPKQSMGNWCERMKYQMELDLETYIKSVLLYPERYPDD